MDGYRETRGRLGRERRGAMPVARAVNNADRAKREGCMRWGRRTVQADSGSATTDLAADSRARTVRAEFTHSSPYGHGPVTAGSDFGNAEPMNFHDLAVCVSRRTPELFLFHPLCATSPSLFPMVPRVLLLLFALAATLPLSRAATTILRGPYLQTATPTSVVVRWRTDATEGSFVRYGTTSDELTQTAKAFGVGTEHIVQLENLQPGTRYFYSVMGSTENKDGDGKVLRVPVYSLTTPPPIGPARETRVWVLGDPGTKNSTQLAVRDAYVKFAADRPADLCLLLGDNAYPDGTDADYQKGIFEVYPELLRTTPVWPALGNHDGHSANSITQSGTYYDIFTLPTRGQAGGASSGTEAYYSFDYANLHFVCLDSHDSDRSTESAMARWLKADLAGTTRDWIVAFFHHPTYTKGTHDSDREKQLIEMRQNFLPILEAAGVDLILTGHSHVYERSFLIDGHYGKSETFDAQTHRKQAGNGRGDGDGVYRKSHARTAHAGEISVVTGSAGQAGSKTKPPSLDHRAMWISLNEPGSVVLDIAGPRLDLTFVNDKGEKRDWFAIEKN